MVFALHYAFLLKKSYRLEMIDALQSNTHSTFVQEEGEKCTYNENCIKSTL